MEESEARDRCRQLWKVRGNKAQVCGEAEREREGEREREREILLVPVTQVSNSRYSGD